MLCELHNKTAINGHLCTDECEKIKLFDLFYRSRTSYRFQHSNKAS